MLLLIVESSVMTREILIYENDAMKQIMYLYYAIYMA